MLEVSARVQIPDDDLSERFVRSGGPGGQNVNKVATKVELRLALDDTQALSGAVKHRLRQAFPSHVTDQGEFLVTSSRYRSQARNRDDAEQRLVEMIRGVLTPPKPRRKTRVPRGEKMKRVEHKKRRSMVKKGRKPPQSD